MIDSTERFMAEAVKEAKRAFEEGEVPVGSVIVHGGRVVARAHNQVEKLKDATAHAEMIAITQASEALDNWRLEETELYVTIEPCPMCAGAMVLSRVSRVIYGADDPIAGACGSVFNIVAERRLNHRIPVVKGILATECGDWVRKFFKRRRNES